MKRRISIILTMIAIMIMAGFTYYGTLNKTNLKIESFITDKNGEVVEPSKTDNDHMGH